MRLKITRFLPDCALSSKIICRLQLLILQPHEAEITRYSDGTTGDSLSALPASGR